MRESSSSLVIARARISCSLRSAKRFIVVSGWAFVPILPWRGEKCEAWTEKEMGPGRQRWRGAIRRRRAAPGGKKQRRPRRTGSAVKGRRHLWGDALRPLWKDSARRRDDSARLIDADNAGEP